MSPKNRVAIDSDIFFFAISDRSSDKKKSQKADALLRHLNNHPEYEILIPISVLGEVVIKCLDASRPHDLNELHELITKWAELRIDFLLPNDAVAEICYLISMKYKDDRLKPTDRVHLAYALAYNMKYLITTDKALLKFPVPSGRELQIISLDKAKSIIR